jgi:SNF2 family DNA or RNA helicase
MNSTNHFEGPLADVCVAGGLDGLIVVPRKRNDFTEARRAIGKRIPALRLYRRADGLFISADDCGLLLDMQYDSTFVWNQEALRFARNRHNAKEILPSVLHQLELLRIGGVSVAREQVGGLKENHILDPHQIVNVAAMTLPEGFGLCVFDEQGAGKTVSFIFAFDLLVDRDQADVALIIAPLSMVAEWPKDIATFTRDLYRVAVLSGSRKDKLRLLGSGADILVTNFETAVSLEPELRAYLRNFRGRAVIAVDESFFIKNPASNRTRAISRLREWCDRAYVLCGTPAPNSAHDLIAQFSFVDFGVTFGAVRIPPEREAAKSLVQQIISNGAPYVRHLKKDVLPDLPAKQFTKVLVRLAPVQLRIYGALLGDYIKALEESDDLSFQKQLGSFLGRRSAMLQVCSNPRSVLSDYEETPAKLVALDRLVQELVQQNREKVVIWSFFTQSLTAIVERYQQHNPVRYDGSVQSIHDRRAAVRAFQEDDTTMLFVGNPAAAGAGLTLHRAKYAIYESFSNQAAHYLQSLDRIHRRGQTRNAEYIVLLCDQTLEISEFERVEEKERHAQQLLGDSPNQNLTRQSMLEEALQAFRLMEATHAPEQHC